MKSAPASSFSLRRRLLTRLLLPLLALLGLSGAGSYAFALHFSNSVYDDWLYDSVNSLALAVVSDSNGPTLNLSESERQLFEWDVSDTTYFAVRDSHGKLLGGNAELSAAPTDAAPLRGAKVFDTRVDDHVVRAVSLAFPPRPGDRHAGDGVSIIVAETERKRHALAREILISTVLPQALLIGVAALLIWLGVRRGLEPLESVAERIEAQSHRRLEPIADGDVPVEVQPLTRALNALLSRLDAALTAQRRFIADAAHQLRTPLTALKLNIEQAQAETELEQVRPMLAQLRVSAERAARLSNQLLALARAEPDAMIASAFIRFDLAALAQEIGAEWVPRALSRKIELSFRSERLRIEAWGDPLLVREALNNLLDNAVKYHPGKGAIAVSVDALPRPSVTITDNGPGIAEPLLRTVFTRFHRGDHDGKVEGSGLGLAIVQEIAQTHGGQIVLDNSSHGLSARFELRTEPIG